MLTMTSRRKQIKPIKAHSNPVSVHNTFVVSDIVDSGRCDETPSGVNSVISREDSMDTAILKIEMGPESNGKSESVDEVKIPENPHSIIPLCGISEDITKKIHKDDAKILPFETNEGIDIFQCPICNESSIRGRESLTCHLQEHQNKTKRDDGKHLCCLCAKELSSNSSLERHLLTHSNHRPFSCILCDKKFTTNGNLSRHIKTSHNNNGTIDSSIDEVLKKHHFDSPVRTLSESNAARLKKSQKSLRKDLLNTQFVGPKSYTMNMNFMTPPLGYMDQSKSDGNTYQQIIQPTTSNMNLLAPFYSFNVNDLGFIHTDLSKNFNVLNQDNLPIVKNNSSYGVPYRHNHGHILERKHLYCLLPARLLATRKYRRKIDYYVHTSNHMKKNICSTNSITCAKCHRRIMLSINVLSHIRYCYKSHIKTHLFCPFKVCSKKSITLKSLLKHIKSIHLETYYPSIEPVSPPMEPLNLSIKDRHDQTTESDHRQSPQVTVNRPRPSDNILDLSGSHSTGPIISIPSFQSMNQFISTPTMVTLSPFSFSTPLTFASSSFVGKPASVPVIVSNGALQSSSHPQWNDKISPFCSLTNFSKASNDTEICSSNSMTSSFSSKYMTGIKKKNSYKDAPKLITCPMDGCVQKFPWNSSLMRHILTHTAHKPFKCTRCVKSFSTKSNRERHMTRVHRVRINRSKFKCLQASKAAIDDLSKTTEDGVDSDNGVDVTVSIQETDMKIIELSEEEWIIMDDNDRRAEDISSNLLKLAGQPIVEPNPVRLHSAERKVDINKSESTMKKLTSIPNEQFIIQDNCT